MYKIPNLDKILGFKHYISTVDDGNMSTLFCDEAKVLQNRRGFLEKCDIEEQEIAYMYSKEVHNKFIVVDKNSKDLGIIEPYGIKADGIITSDPNIALMLIVGDCITTLFYDPISHAIGIAHCGTKWIDNGTAEKTISLMEKQFQTNPKNLIVGIGPSIFIGSFEYEFWTPSNPNYWEGCVKKTKEGKYLIDNRKANLKQLLSKGVIEKNIYLADIDTYKDKRFYSHVRSRDTGEEEGRFTVLIKLDNR